MKNTQIGRIGNSFSPNFDLPAWRASRPRHEGLAQALHRLVEQAVDALAADIGRTDVHIVVTEPRYAPELNPVENVWQFMRDNWLSNRIFKSYDDIVDHCCFAWNRLAGQPWRIMSIGMRKWAHGF